MVARVRHAACPQRLVPGRPHPTDFAPPFIGGIVPRMNRREFLAGVAAAPLAAAVRPEQALAAQAGTTAPKRNPIRQSVMASVWGNTSKLSFEERCQILAKIGFKGVDLPTVEQVPIMKKYGLAPAMMTGAGTTFQDGLIRKELHDERIRPNERREPSCRIVAPWCELARRCSRR